MMPYPLSEFSDVKAREILDSRGNPTVEAEVICEAGIAGRASVRFRCFYRKV